MRSGAAHNAVASAYYLHFPSEPGLYGAAGLGTNVRKESAARASLPWCGPQVACVKSRRLLLDQVADKWTILILEVLCASDGRARLNALRRHTITPLGYTLEVPFKALNDWAAAYLPEVEEAQHRFDSGGRS